MTEREASVTSLLSGIVDDTQTFKAATLKIAIPGAVLAVGGLLVLLALASLACCCVPSVS